MSRATPVLLVAFQFPPFKGSSGLERTLGFCRALPAIGWQPIVLSATANAYVSVSQERMRDLSSEVVVHRAFALDTARHLMLAGRYPRWAALPDRWASWLLGAVPAGWRICRRDRPKVIWSTYPIATAHRIGYHLSRLTGIPWVADFRDPMVERDERTGQDYPEDPGVRNAFLKLEGLAARHASALVFCTRGAANLFSQRYPEVDKGRIHIIPNGFDEAAFASAPVAAREFPLRTIHMLHSGVLYPGPDRDPTPFLQGLRNFLDQHPEWSDRIVVTLRATAHDDRYRPVIHSLGLSSTVRLAPVLPYRDALAEMMSADVLLVFQGYTSNPAIPAKVYEYFRAARPILALVDDDGDTAALLREERVGCALPIEDAGKISAGLATFLQDLLLGQSPIMSAERRCHFERGARAHELAAVFERVLASAAAGNT